MDVTSLLHGSVLAHALIILLIGTINHLHGTKMDLRGGGNNLHGEDRLLL
jgi:hypothetical protein